MKRWLLPLLIMTIILLFSACSVPNTQPNIAATTLPVYTFTTTLCSKTPITVNRVVQENISCLHDYTLTVKHMQILEQADYVVISGGGLEDFLRDALPVNKAIIDASIGIETKHHAEHHDSSGHHHDSDPHFWLSIASARQMAHTICTELKKTYPQYTSQFEDNLIQLDAAFDKLEAYAKAQLETIRCRDLITFHDGFSYMAEELGLTILLAVEEESGSEASAKDLITICKLVSDYNVPAIFTEKNSSDSAANVIARETGVKVFSLDMAISGNDYFQAMYYNIDTLKEALG